MSLPYSPFHAAAGAVVGYPTPVVMGPLPTSKVGGGADAVRGPDGTWCICYLLHHAQVTSTHLEVHPSSGRLQEHQQSASTNTLDPCEHRALQQLHFAMTKDVHRFVYMLLGVLDTSDDHVHEHEVCTGAK